MRRVLAATVLLAAALSYALAQNSFYTPGNTIAPGYVQMCLDLPANVAVPCNGTPVVASFSGANTSSQALQIPTPGAAYKQNYTCGFTVGGLGATALTNVVVSMALANGTLNYQYSYPAGATVPTTTLNVSYSPCIGTAVFSSQGITVPGAAGNTSTIITLTGFTQ